MTTRSMCWGLLGASLAFGQAVPPPPQHERPLGALMGDLSQKLKPYESQKPYHKSLNGLTGQFSLEAPSRRPRKVIFWKQPKVCAAPLLEAKPAAKTKIRTFKPTEPLPRMPQLEPPAVACPPATAEPGLPRQ